jgi:hypothetical protein
MATEIGRYAYTGCNSSALGGRETPFVEEFVAKPKDENIVHGEDDNGRPPNGGAADH